jgi:hypothetical protein
MLLTAVITRYLIEANKGWQDPVRAYLESRLNEVRARLQAPGVSAKDATALAQQEAALLSLLEPLHQSSDAPESPSGPPARVLTDPYPVAKPVGLTPLFAAATGATTAFVIAALVVLVVARRRLRS